MRHGGTGPAVGSCAMQARCIISAPCPLVRCQGQGGELGKAGEAQRMVGFSIAEQDGVDEHAGRVCLFS